MVEKIQYKERCVICFKYFDHTFLIRGRCKECNSVRTIGHMNTIQIPSFIMKMLDVIKGDRIKLDEENGKIYIKKYIKKETIIIIGDKNSSRTV